MPSRIITRLLTMLRCSLFKFKELLKLLGTCYNSIEHFELNSNYVVKILQFGTKNLFLYGQKGYKVSCQWLLLFDQIDNFFRLGCLTMIKHHVTWNDEIINGYWAEIFCTESKCERIICYFFFHIITRYLCHLWTFFLISHVGSIHNVNEH